ncbi:MAG TPA: alpha/beta hydrolase [Puia sp.]|nr:alpha/beta hydrolase [Puia sp.]
MKKIIFLLAIGAIVDSSCAQDFQKLSQDFDAQLRNEAILYGHDSTVGKFYDIRGIKMYCEIYGSGQPLLIIHGNGGSLKDFMYQIPYFSKKYKVIVADSRSQGRSADAGDSLTYEMMTDDYAALLTALNIDSAFVIGWSDGGIEGLLLAIRHPEKVKKLAVTGANLSPDTTAVSEDIFNLVMPYYTKLKNKTNKTTSEKQQLKLVRLEAEEPHIPLLALHAIKIPTLVIGGDHDILKPAHTLLIFQNIPNAYLWILPNSGHSTPVAYKDDFNRTVDHFFSTPYRKIEKNARGF